MAKKLYGKTITIHLNPNTVGGENKGHLDAQMRFPARVFKNKKAYDRKRDRKNIKQDW